MSQTEISIRLFPYGHSKLSEGAFLDPSTYQHVDALLSGHWRDESAADPAYFSRALIDLSLFCDIFCLRDDIFCFSPMNHRDRKPRFLKNKFIPHNGVCTYIFSDQIMPLSFHTIDDEQRSRIFSRWVSFYKSEYLRNKDRLPPEEVEDVLYGVLVEEFVQSSAYIPGMRSLDAYLATDPHGIELRTHNLLLSALSHLDASFRKKITTRAALAGTVEPRLPPILSMILASVSTPSEIMEALLDWRRKFRPLRRRYAEITEVSRSDLPLETWEKEYRKLTRDVQRFLQRFELADKWHHTKGVSPWELAGSNAKMSPDELSLDLTLKLSSVIKLGLEQIVAILRRARIRPLPALAGRLGRLQSLSRRLESVFGREWSAQDTVRFDALVESQAASWARYGSTETGSIHVTRPFPRASSLYSTFYLDSMFDEFLARIYAGPSKRDQAKATMEIGLMALEDGAPWRAEYYLSQALSLAPRSKGKAWAPVIARSLAGLARIEGRLGRDEEARALYEQAIAAAPHDAWVLNDYAAYLSSQQDPQAVALLDQAVTSDPSMQQAWLNLAASARMEDDLDQAIECYRKASEIEGIRTSDAFLQLGLMLAKNGKHHEAVAAMRRAAELSPDDGKIWVALVAHLVKVDDFIGAAQAIARVDELDPDEARGDGWAILAADCLRLSGNYEQAIARLEPIVRRGRPACGALRILAMAQHELGNHALAAKSLRSAHRLDRTDPESLRLLFVLSKKVSNHQEALRAARQLARDLPAGPLGHVLVGDALLALGRRTETLQPYRKAVANGLKAPLKFYNLAVTEEQQNDWQAAIAYHMLEIEMSGDYAPSYANMAADQYELGDHASALANARKAVELDPTDPINLNMLSNMYLVMKDFANAKPILANLASSDTADERIRETARRNLAALAETRMP